jgi:hypothetical protein
VERWFAELTTTWIKRSAHRSVRDLVASIRTWMANWNAVGCSWRPGSRRGVVVNVGCVL